MPPARHGRFKSFVSLILLVASCTAPQPAPNHRSANAPEIHGPSDQQIVEEASARLKSMHIGDIDFEQTALSDVFIELSKRLPQPICANWTALSAAGIENDHPVSFKAVNPRGAEVLLHVLELVGGGETQLAYCVQPGCIDITTREDLDRRTTFHIYQVADLIGHGQALIRQRYRAKNTPLTDTSAAATQPVSTRIVHAGDDLVDLIEIMIEPDSWRALGGNGGSIRMLNRFLVVDLSPAAQPQLVDMLETLRAVHARGLSFDGSESRRSTSANQNSAPAWDPADPAFKCLVGKVVDVQFRATPLQDALLELERRADVLIIADWNALNAAKVSPDQPVTLSIKHATLSAALKLILQAVAAPARPLDFHFLGNCIRISTRAELEHQPERRIYDVSRFVGPGVIGLTFFDTWIPSFSGGIFGPSHPPVAEPAHSVAATGMDQLIELIITSINPGSWRDRGGTTGVIRPYGHHLFVQQTREAHEKLNALLTELGAASAGSKP